jgi:AcrR family transcriptional regulator
MAENQLDRRIQKTLKLLQNALAELIAEKDYDDITIQEILDRANVGRSTFYAHFENKDHLLRNILTYLNEQFEEGIKQISEEHKTFEENSPNLPFRVVRFVEQNRWLFQAMLGKQRQSNSTNPLYDYLFTVTREHFRMMLQIKHGDAAHIEMVAHFYTSAFIGALTWWLDHNIIYSSEEFSQQINRLILPGLKTILDD